MNTPKEVFAWVKTFGTEEDKKRYRVLWNEMQRMDKRIKELEAIHDRHMAPQMFDSKSDIEAKVREQIELNRKRLASPAVVEKQSLKQRLRVMIDSNQVGSKEWIQTLKWNRLEGQDVTKIEEFILREAK